MARVNIDDKGRKLIRYTDSAGKRRTLRLGRMPLADVDTIRGHVAKIVQAQITGRAVPVNTSNWLNEISPTLQAKLAKFGLVAVQAPSQTLQGLIDLLAASSNVKPSTQAARATTHKLLKEYFGADRAIDTITEGDAETWRNSIKAGWCRKHGPQVYGHCENYVSMCSKT